MPRPPRGWLVLLWSGGAAAGCFDPPPFRIVDATPVPVDARLDAAVDATPDAGPDAGPPDARQPCDLPSIELGLATLAGCEDHGLIDGPRGTARFSDPVNIAVAPDGNVYLADFDSHAVRAITPDGTTTTLIYQDGFQRPFGISLGPPGFLYVETDDTSAGQHSDETGTLWRVDIAAATATPLIEHIGRPRGVLHLPDGRLALADNEHHVVRIYDPALGVLALLAGSYDQPGMVDASGADARFDAPYDLALLSDGALAVADHFNHRIRRVTLAGEVTTLAGTGEPGHVDGPAATAQFARPQGVTAAVDGTLYITDIDNYRVRRLRDGEVDTIAGDGAPGSLDADDPLAGRLYGLEGIDLDEAAGRLYVTDGDRGDEELSHHRVRIIQLDALR